MQTIGQIDGIETGKKYTEVQLKEAGFQRMGGFRIANLLVYEKTSEEGKKILIYFDPDQYSDGPLTGEIHLILKE